MLDPYLLPRPKTLRRGTGFFALRSNLPIVLRGTNDDDIRSARALHDAIHARTGLRLPIETHARTSELGPRIELRRDDGRSAESYQLRVRPDAIIVTGTGAPGLRYGVETLGQLLARGHRRIESLSIDDAPALETRGLLIDVSRGKVPTVDTVKAVMDLMVTLKLNLLMLYTEHTFQFRRHPAIGRGASPMSASDVLALDAYAAERHIDLVPTLQSLGHMHHMLKIRRYRHLAESERRWSVSPSVPDTYELLADLYSEYLPNFRSEWFNANCDEPVDLGKGLSKQWAERKGRGDVFRTHLERVTALAKQCGKRTMFWGDVVHEHPEQIPRLGRESVLLDWWYEADHDFKRVRVFAEHAIPFMSVCGTSSWNALFPRGDNAVANITGHANAAKKYGAVGLINTDWGDNGHYNLLGNSLFGFAWGAQAAWGSTRLDPRAFERAFSLQLFYDPSGVAGRTYRKMGGLHETGFAHFNHSPLKSIYFDDVSEAKFISKVEPRTLARTLGRLETERYRIRRYGHRFDARPVAKAELAFAIDASILAAEKGLKKRRAKTLWNRQRALLERHQALWLDRNRPSDFEPTKRLYERSIASLSDAGEARKP